MRKDLKNVRGDGTLGVAFGRRMDKAATVTDKKAEYMATNPARLVNALVAVQVLRGARSKVSRVISRCCSTE